MVHLLEPLRGARPLAPLDDWCAQASMKEHMTPTGDTGLVRLDRWTMGPKEPTENSPCSSGVVDMAS